MRLKYCDFWKARSGSMRHPCSERSTPHCFMATASLSTSLRLLPCGSPSSTASPCNRCKVDESLKSQTFGTFAILKPGDVKMQDLPG